MSAREQRRREAEATGMLRELAEEEGGRGGEEEASEEGDAAFKFKYAVVLLGAKR